MQSLVSVSSEGGSSVAIDAMTRALPAVAKGLRRGIPFLTRRRVEVVADIPELVELDGLVESLVAPAYATQLATDPGGNRALISLDGHAIAFLLEGTLGGDGKDIPRLNTEGLTPAQTAFIERVSHSLIHTLSLALRHSIGLTLTPLPARAEERATGGPLIAVRIRFESIVSESSDGEELIDDEDDEFLFVDMEDDEPVGENVTYGTLLLAVSKSALNAARARASDRPRKLNPKAAASLGETKVDLAAELGRVRMPLYHLLSLRRGDTLRLPVAVGSSVDVRVEGERIFRAIPTTVGTQLALEIGAPVTDGSR
ncbi:MAG: FliM/FliN family flagellar motor switch protein [Myxococcota bacterium]